MKCFGHHAGGTGHESPDELQYRDQSVGKERAENSQHTGDSFVYENESSIRIIAEKCGAINCGSVEVLTRIFAASCTFEFTALEEADELTVFAYNSKRTDSVAFHQFASVIERRRWARQKTAARSDASRRGRE